MSVVKDYMEKGGGNWAKADNVATGAKVTIVSIYLDNRSFDDDDKKQSYIVVIGTYDPTGEEIKARLGIQNLKRVVDVLGDDETTWPNNKLVVLGTQDYPRFNSKGILWSAERVVQQSQI